MENSTAIFCNRVWSTDEEIYLDRLRSIDFTQKANVLDAGGGCGQWSNALSKLNEHVDYVEPDTQRVDIAKQKIKQSNIAFFNTSLEDFSFKDDHYDCIFCYSVIYFCDLENILTKFYKSLKKGGKIYICSNNIEFYFHNIVNDHNSNPYFDAKKNGMEIIKNTLMMFQNEVIQFPVVYSDIYMEKILHKIGFTNITVDNEGGLSKQTKSFYPQEIFGYKAVYEIIAYK